MQAARGVLAVAGLALLVLAGCGDDSPELMNLRATGNGPDEFAILPSKPLQMPENLAALPTPTVGGANRTDPTPNADAILALGGDPTPRGVPAADSAILAATTRNGISADIRQVLASEDLDWRRRRDGRLLERLFAVNVYYDAYRPMSLDQTTELERWRSVGARTPSAPPVESLE